MSEGYFLITGDGQTLKFDSYEEAMEAERKQQKIAANWISEDQKEMGDGRQHYFVKPIPFGDQILFIFGWTWDWYRDDEEIKELDGEERDEREYENKVYREACQRGYVFTRSFSVVEPVGELGSHHLSTLIPIQEAEFRRAKEGGWEPTPDVFLAIRKFIAEYRTTIK